MKITMNAKILLLKVLKRQGMKGTVPCTNPSSELVANCAEKFWRGVPGNVVGRHFVSKPSHLAHLFLVVVRQVFVGFPLHGPQLDDLQQLKPCDQVKATVTTRVPQKHLIRVRIA